MTQPYKRKEQIGDATLYLGDCLEILATLPKANAVIGDPPYEKEAHTDVRRTNKSIRFGRNDVIGFTAINNQTRKEVSRLSVACCSGWVLFFCQVEATSAWRDAVVLAGAKYRRSMVWVKPDSSPQFNGQGPAQGFECISASWAGEGKSTWNAGGKRGVYTHNCNSGRHGDHPTEKPVGLMSELIDDFTSPGDIVLDPFMGSGSTGVACASLGRKFVGIEIEERYFDIAVERMRAAYAQGRLFQ